MLANDLKLTQNSYYAASANEQPQYPKLESDIEADVCVVGGGFAGLSSAIELADRGYKVVVLEANHIGFGASGRNGGQIIAGLACEIDVIEKALGFDAAKQVWNMTLEALDLVRERVKRFDIKCDLTEVSPPYDHAELTSNAAAELVWTWLCGRVAASGKK